MCLMVTWINALEKVFQFEFVYWLVRLEGRDF